MSVMELQDNPFLNGTTLNLTDFHFLGTFNVSNTAMDVCGATSGSTYGYACGLETLVSSACSCPTLWPSCNLMYCPVASPSLVPTPTPIAAPIAAPPIATPPEVGNCVQPPSRPGPPPIPIDIQCPQPPPQGPFTCVSGVWTSQGSVTVPSVTIPENAQVVVNGNLTVSTTITISGTDSQIVVSGCVFLSDPSQPVVIQLTKQDLEKLSKEGHTPKVVLTSTSGNECPGSTDLATVSVTAQVVGSSCKRARASNEKSSRSSLSVLFTIDSSKCNIVAIVVPSVIGGVIILSAVGALIYWKLRTAKFATAK